MFLRRRHRTITTTFETATAMLVAVVAITSCLDCGSSGSSGAAADAATTADGIGSGVDARASDAGDAADVIGERSIVEGGDASCDQLQMAALAAFDNIVAANNSCARDTDCTNMLPPGDCIGVCDYVVSITEASMAAAAAAQLCAEFDAQRCRLGSHSCPRSTAAVCNGGMCTAAPACGSGACADGQVCVEPACCPSCGLPWDGGACPDGSTVGNCPIGGIQTCIVPCTPPPPYCVDVQEPCDAASLCECVADSGCGPTGGMCSGSGVFQCNGCY
jgi:hypothetical protein